MQIRTESIHFTADQKLLDYIDKKVTRLGHYYNRIIEAHVLLKLENTGQVRDKIVEIKLHVPGDMLMTKRKNKTFESSIDDAVDTLKRQLVKKKERSRSYL